MKWPLYHDQSVEIPATNVSSSCGCVVHAARDEATSGAPERKRADRTVKNNQIGRAFDADYLSVVGGKEILHE
jgi:hypothetical protein